MAVTTKRAKPTTRDNMPTREELLARAGQWEERLLGGPITYFPVRHHSPACAKHLAAWIDQIRPDSIVIEGPRSFDKWIRPLTSDDCTGPVAMLTTYREEDAPTSPRHSAFYPMCDYSPEWVALRHGVKLGARVCFADLEFADKVRIQNAKDDESKTLLGVLLADDAHLRHSRFINELIRRMGCRDFDELWDHLFEARADGMSTERLVSLLATYCDLSRESHDKERLHSDGTLAREAVMVDVIRAEYKRLKKPQRKGALLVVTGGFHTVALPEAVDKKGNPHRSELEPVESKRTGSWLIRYSYDQLDSYSGYRSGMPSPGFYDALWRADRDRIEKRTAIARLVTTIARETRGKPIQHEASVTDSIAAVQMLNGLADLRGHEAPTRTDMLDAIASCMRKESAAGADLLATIVQRTLAGDRVGQVPASAGQPPIIEDFKQLATSYRLPIDTIESRGVNLELYRKAQHRHVSFLLHQLQMLEVPYAIYVDGPDFINGYHLRKLREEWKVSWSPGTEARLAEMALYGDTVGGAAAQRIVQRMDELAEEGVGRSADVAVDLLIRTCRCGLHQYAEQIVEIVAAHIAEDAVFASVARGLNRLVLLRSAREPLEAERLSELTTVTNQCYQRAVYLIDTLAAVPDDQLDASLDGMVSIRELLTTQAVEEEEESDALLDQNLFVDALQRLIRNTGDLPRSEIAGAAVGILHGLGVVDEKQVCDIVRIYLDAAIDDVAEACGVVRGLMMTSREAFWRSESLLSSINELFERWDTGRFNNALPHMRLAFSQLSPKEVDSVAKRVAELHKVDEIGDLVHPDISEDEIHVALRVADLMNQSLSEDGLA